MTNLVKATVCSVVVSTNVNRGQKYNIQNKMYKRYRITCFQRPSKRNNENGLSQQVVLVCRSYYVKLEKKVLNLNSGIFQWWIALYRWFLTQV